MMNTGVTPLIDIVSDVIPEEMAQMLFLGFSVQRMSFFNMRECWTVLLTAEKAEFFHWYSQEKHFVIPRSQASQAIYIPDQQPVDNFILVKRPSGQFCFFRATTANAEMLRDWLGVATKQGRPSAFISNLYELVHRPLLYLA